MKNRTWFIALAFLTLGACGGGSGGSGNGGGGTPPAQQGTIVKAAAQASLIADNEGNCTSNYVEEHKTMLIKVYELGRAGEAVASGVEDAGNPKVQDSLISKTETTIQSCRSFFGRFGDSGTCRALKSGQVVIIGPSELKQACDGFEKAHTDMTKARNTSRK